MRAMDTGTRIHQVTNYQKWQYMYMFNYFLQGIIIYISGVEEQITFIIMFLL